MNLIVSARMFLASWCGFITASSLRTVALGATRLSIKLLREWSLC
jgi:hypothetical protein